MTDQYVNAQDIIRSLVEKDDLSMDDDGVTHCLIGSRGDSKLVVSGPYVRELDEWGNVRPWRVSLVGVDDDGDEIVEVIHRSEFSDAAEEWAGGFMAAFARIDKRIEQMERKDSHAPF